MPSIAKTELTPGISRLKEMIRCSLPTAKPVCIPLKHRDPALFERFLACSLPFIDILKTAKRTWLSQADLHPCCTPVVVNILPDFRLAPLFSMPLSLSTLINQPNFCSLFRYRALNSASVIRSVWTPRVTSPSYMVTMLWDEYAQRWSITWQYFVTIHVVLQTWRYIDSGWFYRGGLFNVLIAWSLRYVGISQVGAPSWMRSIIQWVLVAFSAISYNI